MNSPDCRLDKSSFVVLTDIHADTEAMRAVLRAAWDPSIVKYRCFLGDAIGYGNDPILVLDNLADFDVMIKGNHELLALDEADPDWYSRPARRSIMDHAQMLTPPHRTFISQFTDTFISGNIILFHGNPESALEYIFTAIDSKDLIERHPRYDIFFGGHMHIPRLVSYDKNSGEIDYHEIKQPYSKFLLDLNRYRYLVTCPSTTPGRFPGALPGCCRLQHQSDSEKILEFIFTILSSN